MIRHFKITENVTKKLGTHCKKNWSYQASLADYLGQRGRVVSVFDLRSRGRGFDHAIALGKKFTLTFPSPPTCKLGTCLKAVLEILEILVFEHLTGGRTVMQYELNLLWCV
ncbi:hypothetical protein ElyMa_000331300 [Elysia marginata]|uniref:Uncharacterized protein n=1 Tax=Elysia marginata TaxID=1093978 RepID=A0AAV4FDT8_9GAST|nr:hypothetical protein ElyMa_000331300 [Elysia marginata]